MLRVTHVIKVTSIAGAETHLLTLLKGLRKRQVDAQVIMLRERDQPMDDYVQALGAIGISVDSLIIHADMDPTLIYRVRQRLTLIKPRIVHTHLFHADLYGAFAARWAQVPRLVSSRHNDNAFRQRQPYRRINQTLWQMADAGIAISESVARFAVEVESAPRPKIQVIPYGLDFISMDPAKLQATRQQMRQHLGLDADTPVIGMVCRLVEQKGIVYGLRAFAQLRDSFPEARLLIAGEGPLRAELEAEAQHLGLGEAVNFLGWRDDVPQLMTVFDLLLMPSLWEGFGLVILEAMSKQIPVVASAVSAIPEIVVHGETGLLVPPKDVESLATALATLMADRPLRAYMGQNAEDRLESRYSARRMVNDTVDLYRKLI